MPKYVCGRGSALDPGIGGIDPKGRFRGDMCEQKKKWEGG